MKSAFPFQPNSLCDILQRCIVNRIHDPTFTCQLPDLSDSAWASITTNDKEKERLEFLGDARMAAAISEELYRANPSASPNYYTNARSVLVANSTFAHLMHAMGCHNMDDPVKPAGDAFETILAAYHEEQGQAAFQTWVRQTFRPLINIIGPEYDKYRNNVMKNRQQNRKKQGLTNTYQLLNVRSRKNMKTSQLLIYIAELCVDDLRFNPGKRHKNQDNHSHQSRRASRSPLKTLLIQRGGPLRPTSKPIFVDLTVDSDSDSAAEVEEVSKNLIEIGQTTLSGITTRSICFTSNARRPHILKQSSSSSMMSNSIHVTLAPPRNSSGGTAASPLLGTVNNPIMID